MLAGLLPSWVGEIVFQMKIVTEDFRLRVLVFLRGIASILSFLRRFFGLLIGGRLHPSLCLHANAAFYPRASNGQQCDAMSTPVRLRRSLWPKMPLARRFYRR